MKERNEKIRVLFHHGYFSKYNDCNLYFGAGGPIHKNLERISKQKLIWNFVGGFINKNHSRFWKLASNSQILFIRTQNMDYGDIHMLWHQAESSMLEILRMIKEQYPQITIFIYEGESLDSKKFEKYGTQISDLHGDEKLIQYFKKK